MSFCYVDLQIPHGRKYEKKWLLTALQNICSVQFTPVQVTLTTDLYIYKGNRMVLEFPKNVGVDSVLFSYD